MLFKLYHAHRMSQGVRISLCRLVREGLYTRAVEE
jgi:hypothetical protein